MYEDRSFVDPNCPAESAAYTRQPLLHYELASLPDAQQQTNTNPYSPFSPVESYYLVASSDMLRTVKQVTEELLASSMVPFDLKAQSAKWSDVERRARRRLARMGLNEFQARLLLDMEVHRQQTKASKLHASKSKNIVYQATKKRHKVLYEHRGTPKEPSQ